MVYSQEFPFSVKPVREGVYQVLSIWGNWHYSLYVNGYWCITCDTAKDASKYTGLVTSSIHGSQPRYTKWRGLSEEWSKVK